jgi:hypothetical protein
MKLRHFDGFAVLTVLILFLFGIAAHAQVGGSVGSAPMNGGEYAPPSHVATATQHDLAPQVSLLGSNSVTVAQGEQPLWQFGELKVEPALGTVAKEYREEHAKIEKAHIHWNQQ